MTEPEQAEMKPSGLRLRLQQLGAEFDRMLAEQLAAQYFPADITGLLDELCGAVMTALPDYLGSVEVLWPFAEADNAQPTGSANDSVDHEVVRIGLSFRPGFDLHLQFRPGLDDYSRLLLTQAIARLFDTLHVRELEYALYADQSDLLQALHDIRQQHAAQREQVDTLETRLLQSEKLAAIGQLAAGVAHEINNPIGYVGSNLNALRDYMADLLHLVDDLHGELSQAAMTAEQKRKLEYRLKRSDLDYIRSDLPVLMQESQEGIERVRRTVQDLKDFSRTDSLDFEWSDINEGLRKTLNIVRYELKHRASVITDFGDLPLVYCAASQLNQVWLNVLLNAGQALETRDEIDLRTRHDTDWVVVEIADNGIGMSEETQRRLFEPFYTTKPAGKGTGLGMPISLRIIELHGGQIDVQSMLGLGTRFAIRLPVNPAKAQEGTP